MRPITFGSLAVGALGAEDRRMLTRLIQRATELEEKDEPVTYTASDFESMLARDRALTEKQRAYVRGVYDRVFWTALHRTAGTDAQGALAAELAEETPDAEADR